MSRIQATPPRVAIIGAGAIGGFFGLMLSRAGADVHYLLRSDYPVAQRNGLVMHSSEYGDFRLAPAQVYQAADDMPASQWVLVGAKATDNAALAPAINRVAAPGATVMLLQNGLLGEAQLRPLLRDDLHLMGGICFVSAHRRAPAVIDHVAYGRIALGYHSGPAPDPAAHTEQALALFAGTGLEALPSNDLMAARWRKLVMNMAFSGLTVLFRCGTRAIMQCPESRALVRDLMQEVADAAAACGYPMPEDYIAQALALNDVQSDFKASMLLDFEQRRPLELDAIYRLPLAAAEEAGCAMPRTTMLYQSLCLLDRLNRAAATD